MTAIKPEQIRWRVGSTSKDKAKGMLLGYIDSRTAMELLDDLSPAWSDEYRIVKVGSDEGVECALTVAGVTRTDVGTPSNTEGLKGAYSDALKRAAVKHGIGRELYELPRIWVALDSFGRPTAEPAFKNGRWVLPSGAGSVFYDHEPEAPPRPTPPAASTARARLASVASEHGVTATDLERIAKEVGADKPATDSQIEQIIALIESPGLSTSEAPAPEQRDSADSLGNAAGAVNPVGPASGNGPQSPEVPVAADSEAGPSLEDVLAAAGPGAEVLPEKPDYVVKAEKMAERVAAEKAGRARKTAPDPEPLTTGLGS